jgi:outer membrane lipoprotein-sorting protein
MKKLLAVFTALIAVAVINAQSLDEIVRKYNAANKMDMLDKVNTIKITGKVSAMGMELPLVLYMKKPDKIKMTYSLNGQNMTTVFDGQKGYSINPITGSAEAVEITGDQLRQLQGNNHFKNQVLDYFKEGKLTLEGEESVNGKPAFKLKAVESGTPVYMYIDKTSYLVVKTSASVEQMGASMNMDSFISEYSEVKGVVMPKKITQMSNGMEAAVVTFDLIEVDVPIDDATFKLK